MVHDEKTINFYCTSRVLPGRIFCVALEPSREDYPLEAWSGRSTCHSKRQVTICAELDGPQEFMTITVCVPISGSEGDDREYGIARAKDFARGFSNLSPSLFPAR
jgi:hypothetical protein